MNAFVAKEISEILHDHMLLNALQLLVVGIWVAECVGDNVFGNQNTLRVCDNGEFRIFPLLQMRSQDTNLTQNYETRSQQKFTKKLNKL